MKFIVSRFNTRAIVHILCTYFETPSSFSAHIYIAYFYSYCAGLIPRAIVHIFEGKTAEEDEDTLYDVRVSYIEIYNEEIRLDTTVI